MAACQFLKSLAYCSFFCFWSIYRLLTSVFVGGGGNSIQLPSDAVVRTFLIGNC